MLKVGDRVYHSKYGGGEVVKLINKTDSLIVCFDDEFDVLVGKVIDTDYYFEDTRKLEKSRFIEVNKTDVEKDSHYLRERETGCYSCKKPISTMIHGKCEVCGGIICDCGACFCNKGDKFAKNI